MTRPVLFHKMANYDLDFFCPEADFLRLLVDDILHEFEDGERYYRMYASVDRVRRAVLVQWSVMRRYNAVGQRYMVRAARHSTSLCDQGTPIMRFMTSSTHTARHQLFGRRASHGITPSDQPRHKA